MSKQGMSSLGISIKVDNQEINYVQELGDLGGKPTELDATCLKDRVKKHIPGVQEAAAFEVTYLFDNSASDSDYRIIKALQDSGSVKALEVLLPDGTKYASSGYINTYVVGAKVDELMTAKLVVSLQSDWTVTNPAANG